MERKTEPTRYEIQSRQRIKQIIDEYCNGSQQEFSSRTGVAKASISQYVNGKNVPSNLTAKKLCSPFGINPAWLMGFDVPMRDEQPETTGYYFDEETAQMAQELFENKDLRVLFSAARTAKAEDLKTTYDMLMALKRKEGYDGDDPA